MRTPKSLRLSTWFLGALFAASACSKIIDVDIGAGLGATCSRDEECQASDCLDGICTLACGDTAGCPGGSVCTAGLCELPVNAGFVYPYPTAQDELADVVEAARLGLMQSRPEVSSVAISDAPLTADAVARANAFVDQGAAIVVASSPTHGDGLLAFAAEVPDVTVFAFGAPRSGQNLVSFDVRAYQAYYLAGVAAARTSGGARLGMLGSIPSPAVLSRINGFILGARSVHPAILVELIWMNAWHDMGTPQNGETRERIETINLVGRGADVVAHVLDNNISALTIADLVENQGANAFAVAAGGPDACAGLPAGRCVGAVYYQLAPLLARMVHLRARDQLAGGVVLEGLRVSETESAFGFAVGAGLAGGQALSTELDQIRTTLAQATGVGPVFAGPISSAECEAELGAAPCVAVGETLSDSDLASMCWLADGAISFDGAVDQPASVPPSCADWLP